jgi:hypothetical protein
MKLNRISHERPSYLQRNTNSCTIYLGQRSVLQRERIFSLSLRNYIPSKVTDFRVEQEENIVQCACWLQQFKIHILGVAKM